MGRRSIRADKTIYQLSREAAHMTREEAGEAMGYVSEDRIEKIEAEKTTIRPDEVLAMADAYHDRALCSRYCTQACPIGQLLVPPVEDKPIAQVTLELVSHLNTLYEYRDRMIEIAVHDDAKEIGSPEYVKIVGELQLLARSINSLNLYVSEKLDISLL